jgi:dipeptidyl aminopeptidase/acylaminoacyl peptidase
VKRIRDREPTHAERSGRPMWSVSAGALRAFVWVVLACAAAAGAHAQDSSGFRPDDLERVMSVGQARLAADGRTLAYTVGSSGGTELRVMDTQTGESRSLGPGSSPRWSPDGAWLLFNGRDDTGSGLVVIRPDGTQRRVIARPTGTNHPLPSTGESAAWSPDGRQIVYVSATEGPEPPEAGADGEPIVIRRYLYKTTGSDGRSYFNDNRRLHLFVVDVATGATRQITDGNGYEHSVDWSPDGREILFLRNEEPDPDRFFNYDISAVDVATGRIRPITRRENPVYRARWSPDGSTIAFQGTRRGLTSSETTMEDTKIWLVDRDGSNARALGADLDHRQGAPQWSPDGRWVYFTLQDRGHVHLARLPAAGGRAERVVTRAGRVGDWSVARSGNVAFSFTGPGDDAQLHLLSGREIRALTALNAPLLAERTVAPVEAFTFVSFDGLEVEAFLTQPLGRTADSKHPMIVVIHGGPHGQQGPQFDMTAQAYAARGWATLMVNYRGSTGYGQAFTDGIFGDQNGAEAMDVLQGVEAAVRRHPWIDRQRLGVEGGSYGGQLANWLVTQTHQFAAAIPRAGISNLVSFNYLSYYHDYLAVEYGGRLHQADIMDRLWERSPIRHVAKVRTPVLLVHGQNDHNVPTSEAEQFFIALQDVGVETELVLYPRAGHGLRDTAQRIDFLKRSIAWYERHFAQRAAARADAR